MKAISHPPGQQWVTLQLPKTLKADHSYTLKLNFSRTVVAEVQAEK